MLIALSIASAAAGQQIMYNRQGGLRAITSSLTTGQLCRATDGANAGFAAPADDTLLVGNGSTWQDKTVPDCDNATTSKLLYDQGTNAFSCGTDQSGGGLTGSGTDNQVTRWDGTAALQGSGWSIDDSAILSATSGKLGINTAAVPHGGIGGATLAIEGTNGSAANGPHIQMTTASDDYPIVQMLQFSHDNIAWCLDCYYDDVAFKSGDAGSNFIIYKGGGGADQLNIYSSFGVAQGGTIGSLDSALKIAAGEITLNESSRDIDVRIETDNDANAFVLDAGADTLTLRTDLQLDNQRDLRLLEGDANGSNYFAFQAPASITSNATFTWAATGQCSGSNGGALTIDASNNIICSDDDGGAGGGAPTDAQYVLLATNATLSDERVLTAGTAIDVSDAGAGSTVTIDWDSTEANDFTWGDGTDATIQRTYNVQTGTDPVIQYGNGTVNVSTGTLQQGGTAVVLQSRQVASGTGLSGGGDLSADRTLSVNQGAAFTWTNTHDFTSGGLILKSSTTLCAAATGEGSICWDSDDDQLGVGDGAARKVFVDTGRTITAGTGLTGGGDLSANRTLSVDTSSAFNPAWTGTHDFSGGGLILQKHATNCAVLTTDAQVCWDSDDDLLRIGTGSAGVIVPYSSGSVTDDALVRWDGTSGKAVQNSAVALSDAGAMVGARTTTTTSLTSEAAFTYAMTATPGGASLLTAYGVRGGAENTGSNTAFTVYGTSGESTSSGSGGAALNAGLNGVATKSGTGGVANAIGVRGEVRNTNASGAITAGAAFYAVAPTRTGTLTNSYAFYAADQGGSASSTDIWQVYAAGDEPSFFGGPVQVTTADNVVSLVLSDVATNAATKESRLALKHYTNSEEPVALIHGEATSGASAVRIGGGTSQMNTATQIGFYTAADTTTVTGSERGRLHSNGRWKFGADLTDTIATVGIETAATGSPILRLESTSTNDDPYRAWVLLVGGTTDATPFDIGTVLGLDDSATWQMECHITARRTGGSSGAADDGAGYWRRATYKGTGDAIIGSVQTIGTDAESQAGWDATLAVTSGLVVVRVTGATNNNIIWHAACEYSSVGS